MLRLRRASTRTLVPLLIVINAACSTGRDDDDAGREAREAMLFTVATQFRQPAQELEVVEFRGVTWRNACLEIRRRGACARERTPGYRLRIRRNGADYEFRAPAASPSDVALATAPDPRLGTPALEWTWENAPGGCQMLAISTDERPAVGWCDGPMAELEWLSELLSHTEWRHLYRRFAPFQLATGDHTLVFRGAGTESASPAWQRAVSTWASLRWSELRAGRSGAAHGRAIAYRRPDPRRSGRCDVLEVTEYGTAYAGASLCGGGAGEPGRYAWLSDPLWEEMSPWLDEWGPYEDTAGVYVFGRGTREPGPEDVTRLVHWAERAIAHIRSDTAVSLPH